MISPALPEKEVAGGRGGGTATNSITQTLVPVRADSQFHEWNQTHPAKLGVGVERQQCVYICDLHLVYTCFFLACEWAPVCVCVRVRLCVSYCSLAEHCKLM